VQVVSSARGHDRRRVTETDFKPALRCSATDPCAEGAKASDTIVGNSFGNASGGGAARSFANVDGRAHAGSRDALPAGCCAGPQPSCVACVAPDPAWDNPRAL